MSKLLKKLSLFGLVLSLILALCGVATACGGKTNENGGDKCACTECADDCACTDCDGTDCDCHDEGGSDTLTFTEAYVGTWTLGDGDVDSYTVVITENSFTLKEGDTVLDVDVTANVYEDFGETYCDVTVTWDEITYDVTLKAGDMVLEFYNFEFDEDTMEVTEHVLYFLNANLPTDLTVNAALEGSWTSENALAKVITVNADGTLYYDELPATVIAESVEDDSDEFGYVYYQYYFVTAEGEIYGFSAYDYDGTVESLDVFDLVGNFYETYTPATVTSESPLAEFVGTWNVVKEAGTLAAFDTIVITEDDGEYTVVVYVEEEVVTSSFAVGDFNIVTITVQSGGDNFTYTVSADTENLIFLESGDSVLYFLKDGMPTLTVDSTLAGTWTATGSESLVITATGAVSYGPDLGVVVGVEEDGDSVRYRILFGMTTSWLYVDGLGTDTVSLTLSIGEDGYYENMTKTVKEPAFISEDYRDTTWTGDNHTLYVDEDGNVYIDEELCELTNVDDWGGGQLYCTVVWNDVEWTLEINGDTAQLHYGYDDWYTLYTEGGATAVEVPSALLGTTWTGVGDNEFATKTYEKTITIEFAQDGTITVTIGGVTQTATLVSVQEGGHFSEGEGEDVSEWDVPWILYVQIDGDDVDWEFTNGFDGSTFESTGSGYAFTVTKNA